MKNKEFKNSLDKVILYSLVILVLGVATIVAAPVLQGRSRRPTALAKLLI